MTVAMYVDLTDIRTEYARAGLQERALDPSPIRQLERWLREAIEAKHPEPTAMTVATVDAEGQPSARIVLLKTLDDRGLVFFTNYDSDKGHDLAQNPHASASFFWVMLERQVRVSGTVSMVPREESEAYFRSRPRESQIGAWASRQSGVLSGREELDRMVEETRARFGDGEIPCPPNWGGYLLTPSRVEFWQGRPSRLHDRLRYTRAAENTPDEPDEPDEPAAWVIERLSP